MRKLKIERLAAELADPERLRKTDGGRDAWLNSYEREAMRKYRELKERGSLTKEEQAVLTRLEAQLIMWKKCPDYFTLCEPVIAEESAPARKAKAVESYIKDTYPKFYKEVFEHAAETEAEEL